MKNILSAILLGVSTIHPLLAAEDGQEQAQDEVLKLIGDIVDCDVSSQRIKIESNANTILRIEKNGKETATFSLEGVRELLIIRCQGLGMGVSPRSKSLEEGMQIQVIAKKDDGHDRYSVSYTIPAETEQSFFIQTATFPMLYSRKDMARDNQKQLGNLVITVAEKNGEQGGADQPATAPESKSEGKDKPQPESKVAPR